MENFFDVVKKEKEVVINSEKEATSVNEDYSPDVVEAREEYITLPEVRRQGSSVIESCLFPIREAKHNIGPFNNGNKDIFACQVRTEKSNYFVMLTSGSPSDGIESVVNTRIKPNHNDKTNKISTFGGGFFLSLRLLSKADGGVLDETQHWVELNDSGFESQDIRYAITISPNKKQMGKYNVKHNKFRDQEYKDELSDILLILKKSFLENQEGKRSLYDIAKTSNRYTDFDNYQYIYATPVKDVNMFEKDFAVSLAGVFGLSKSDTKISFFDKPLSVTKDGLTDRNINIYELDRTIDNYLLSIDGSNVLFETSVSSIMDIGDIRYETKINIVFKHACGNFDKDDMWMDLSKIDNKKLGANLCKMRACTPGKNGFIKSSYFLENFQIKGGDRIKNEPIKFLNIKNTLINDLYRKFCSLEEGYDVTLKGEPYLIIDMLEINELRKKGTSKKKGKYEFEKTMQSEFNVEPNFIINDGNKYSYIINNALEHLINNCEDHCDEKTRKESRLFKFINEFLKKESKKKFHDPSKETNGSTLDVKFLALDNRDKKNRKIVLLEDRDDLLAYVDDKESIIVPTSDGSKEISPNKKISFQCAVYSDQFGFINDFYADREKDISVEKVPIACSESYETSYEHGVFLKNNIFMDWSKTAFFQLTIDIPRKINEKDSTKRSKITISQYNKETGHSTSPFVSNKFNSKLGKFKLPKIKHLAYSNGHKSNDSEADKKQGRKLKIDSGDVFKDFPDFPGAVIGVNKSFEPMYNISSWIVSETMTEDLIGNKGCKKTELKDIIKLMNDMRQISLNLRGTLGCGKFSKDVQYGKAFPDTGDDEMYYTIYLNKVFYSKFLLCAQPNNGRGREKDLVKHFYSFYSGEEYVNKLEKCEEWLNLLSPKN